MRHSQSLQFCRVFELGGYNRWSAVLLMLWNSPLWSRGTGYSPPSSSVIISIIPCSSLMSKIHWQLRLSRWPEIFFVCLSNALEFSTVPGSNENVGWMTEDWKVRCWEIPAPFSLIGYSNQKSLFHAKRARQNGDAITTSISAIYTVGNPLPLLVWYHFDHLSLSFSVFDFPLFLCVFLVSHGCLRFLLLWTSRSDTGDEALVDLLSKENFLCSWFLVM